MAVFSAFMAITGLSALAGSVSIFGLSAGLSAAIIGVGKSLLWNAFASALAPKAKVTAQEVQATLAQATGPRICCCGQYLLGGTRAVWEVNGGNLYQVIVMHHGEVNAIVGWYVDGEPVNFDASGDAISGDAVGYLNVKAITSGDGGDYADVKAAFPTLWTDDHQLTGLATYRTVFKSPSVSKLSKVFPRQAQTLVQAVVQGAKVIDPRTMATAYTDLSGPCIMDYLISSDGFRIPIASIDLDSFSQFTDLCDEDVTLSAGGTEKRYRIGGYYTLEDAPKDVMARLLQTADAQIYMTPEGKLGILGGEWLDPDVTITSADILSFELSDGVDDFTDFNVLKGIFMSPDHRYQPTECDEMRDAVVLEAQPEMVETYEVDMCPSYTQMRRLMKPQWERQHREWKGTITTNLVGLKARFPRGQGKHIIRLVIDDLEIDQAFEVTGHSYSVADRKCSISVESIENPYTWDAETEEGDAPTALDDLVFDDDYTAPPSGLTLTQEIVTISAGQNATRIVAVVDDPSRDDLQLYAEYRVSPAGAWQVMAAGVGDVRAYSATVSDGVLYDVRASWIGYTDYSATAQITAVSNPTAPSAATGLTATNYTPDVVLDWTNGAAGYYQTRIYRGNSATFSGAGIIATVSGFASNSQSYTDTPSTGTWYYWAVTINASLIEATPTGPAAITI